MALFVLSVLIALNVESPSTITQSVGGHIGWARAITTGLLYIALYGLFVSFGVLYGEFTLPGGVSIKFGGPAGTEDQEDLAALAGQLDVVRDASFRSIHSYGGVAKQLEGTAKALKSLEERLALVETRLQIQDPPDA